MQTVRPPPKLREGENAVVKFGRIAFSDADLTGAMDQPKGFVEHMDQAVNSRTGSAPGERKEHRYHV